MGDPPGWIGSQLHMEEGIRRRKLTTEGVRINFVEDLMYVVESWGDLQGCPREYTRGFPLDQAG